MSKLVYKRKNGQYEARFWRGRDKNGRIKYGSVVGATEEEAIERRRQLLGYDPQQGAPCSEMNILILGAGSYGREAKEALQQLRVFQKIDFLDDNLKGDDIKGKCTDAEFFRQGYPCAFIAIADNDIRKRYAELLIAGHFIIPTIVSPDAIVSPLAKIGMGSMIFSQANIAANAVVGEFSLAQSNSLVNADAHIGDYCRLDSGAIVLKGERLPDSGWIKPGEIYGSV